MYKTKGIENSKVVPFLKASIPPERSDPLEWVVRRSIPRASRHHPPMRVLADFVIRLKKELFRISKYELLPNVNEKVPKFVI